ncbi:cache domain-containing protein [Litoribrevibacter euphylliae]|uniref:Cache domain-containing protein n=1 Tax=Litoribrevibacter euphylliae TaxID=1834034 RepID=A0ABV7HF54_9GAMM
MKLISMFQVRRAVALFMHSFVVCVLWVGQAFAEDVPQSVLDLIPSLKDWGMTPELVQAVKTQNAKGMSLDEIKSRDNEWRGDSRVSPFMKTLMENDAAKKMMSLESSQPYFFELFLMDNQGANVAMTNKTSDYWQGDEAKFTDSFKNGMGAVHVGDVEFDDSAQAYLVQISVPVMESGKAIGAMTIGINLDELEAIQ